LILKIDGYDDAIIGPALIWDGHGRRISVLVYSAEQIRSILMDRDGMDEEEAREFIEFNIEGAYMGPHTPVLVWQDDMYDEAEDDYCP